MSDQILTVFRNRLRPEHRDEYSATSERMTELAREMPGFVDAKTFTADDGERVTVVTSTARPSGRASTGSTPSTRSRSRPSSTTTGSSTTTTPERALDAVPVVDIDVHGNHHDGIA